MPSALLVRLHPTTPWRFGAGAGDVSAGIYHSDSLYAALCSAFAQLGSLDDWLNATAHAPVPAVRLSSCFPFREDTLFVPPPRHLWPPAFSAKVRWKGARYVPINVVRKLMDEQAPAEENWIVDGQSGCLLAVGKGGAATGPFRFLPRTTTPVDRVTGVAGPSSSTTVAQFTPGSGLWFAAAFASADAEAEWSPRVEGALKYLADSGFGGGRSKGFGRAEAPEIRRGDLASLLLPRGAGAASTPAWWILSLFVPGESDSVDWSQGHYGVVTRSGRVESQAGWGTEKKALRMVEEGSVLVSASEPIGMATDVAPDGFAHPVYRAGFALAIPLPWRVAE